MMYDFAILVAKTYRLEKSMKFRSIAAASLSPSLPAASGHPVEHPHPCFGASDQFEQRRGDPVHGDVRVDCGAPAVYATDASDCRQLPIWPLLPLDKQETLAMVTACREVGDPSC